MLPTLRRALAAALLVLGCLLLLPPSARADAGPPDPSPPRSFTFHVTRNGEPLAGKACQVVFLTTGRLYGPKDWQKEPPTWLPKEALYDAEGAKWRLAGRGGAEIEADGTVTFTERRGASGESLSGPFRLAVYLPDEDKAFLSPTTEARSPSRNFYHADLGDSGITLMSYSPLSLAFWKVYLLPVLVATGATLLLHLCVAMTWVAIFGTPPKPYGRVAVVCLLGNLIVAPLLLGVSLGLRMELPRYEGSLGIFFGLQVLAIVIHSLAYSTVGKLSVRGAAGLALTANLAGLGFGCCLVSVPGWYL